MKYTNKMFFNQFANFNIIFIFIFILFLCLNIFADNNNKYNNKEIK